MTACPTVKVSQHTSFALLRFVCRFHFAREEKRNNKKNPYFLTFPNTEKRKHWDGPFILCCLSNNRGSSDNHAAHSQPKMHFLAFPDTLSPYQQPEKIPRHLQRNLFLCNAHFSRFETTNLKISLAGTPLNPTTRSLFTAPAPAPLKKTNIVDSFRLVYAGKCTITSKTNRIEVCFPWKYIFKRFGIHSRLATQALTIIFSSLEMKHFCFIVQFNTAMANKTIQPQFVVQEWSVTLLFKFYSSGFRKGFYLVCMWPRVTRLGRKKHKVHGARRQDFSFARSALWSPWEPLFRRRILFQTCWRSFTFNSW